MADFSIGSGEGAATITIDRTLGADRRTDLGRTLSYAWRHRLSIDVHYGTGEHTFTLTPARIHALAGMSSPQQRITAVARWMRDDGFNADFSDPSARNGCRDNALRVLDAIEEWDAGTAAGGSTSHVVLDPGSNGTSGVVATLPETLASTEGRALPDGFDFGRSARVEGTTTFSRPATTAMPDVPGAMVRPAADRPLASPRIPQPSLSAFEVMHTNIGVYAGGAVLVNGIELPLGDLAAAADAQAAWTLLRGRYPLLSNQQLDDLMRQLSRSSHTIPEGWTGSLRLSTTASDTSVVESGRS